MRTRIALCAVVLVALSACANVKPISAPATANMAYEGKPLTTVTYTEPSFTAMTWGRAGFGAIGGVAMITEGNKLVADNHLADPALAIAAKLTPVVAEKMKTAGGTLLDKRDSNDVAKLVAAANGRGVILDVQTFNWSFMYFPLDWTHYKVLYMGRARLIDAAAAKEIARVLCTWKSDENNPPDYDTLVGNGAEKLKAMLATAAETCAATYRENLFAK